MTETNSERDRLLTAARTYLSAIYPANTTNDNWQEAIIIKEVPDDMAGFTLIQLTAYRTRVDEAIAKVEATKLSGNDSFVFGWNQCIDALKAELANDETITDRDALEVAE